MRDAMVPFVAIVGLTLASFIGGALVKEAVLTYPAALAMPGLRPDANWREVPAVVYERCPGYRAANVALRF